MSARRQEASRLARIWRSYFDLPTWVQVWMSAVLVPINLATLAFLGQPSGALISALALSGMVLTVALIFATGGFSKVTSFGHVVPWTALVLILVFARPEGTAIYQALLTMLLVVDAISLAFDFNDIRLWLTSKEHGHTPRTKKDRE